jgi:hypothetical protein
MFAIHVIFLFFCIDKKLRVTNLLYLKRMEELSIFIFVVHHNFGG